MDSWDMSTDSLEYYSEEKLQYTTHVFVWLCLQFSYKEFANVHITSPK